MLRYYYAKIYKVKYFHLQPPSKVISQLYSGDVFHHQNTNFLCQQACKITRKAKPTIYTLARKGLIPAYKRGKKLYFYEDELLQWIESGRKQMQAMSLQEQAAEIVHGAKRKPKGGYNF